MELFNIKYKDSLIIKIGGQTVKITLLPKKDNTDEYALGIDAPRNISVDREEIYHKKKIN